MRTRDRHRFRQSSKEHLCWFKVAELWAMPPDNRTGEDDASGQHGRGLGQRHRSLKVGLEDATGAS